jgi:hypothetical protein
MFDAGLIPMNSVGHRRDSPQTLMKSPSPGALMGTLYSLKVSFGGKDEKLTVKNLEKVLESGNHVTKVNLPT